MADLNELFDDLDERSLDVVRNVLQFLLDKIDEYEESQKENLLKQNL